MKTIMTFLVSAALLTALFTASTVGTELATTVHSAPPKCRLIDGPKRVVGCNHKDFMVNFPRVGKLFGKLQIAFGAVTATFNAGPGTTISRLGTSALKTGNIPPFPAHAAIAKYCHGVATKTVSRKIVKIRKPQNVLSCCKERIYVSATVTVCTTKLETCTTKSFSKFVRIICANVCRGEGKGGVSTPMSMTKKCPMCVF